MSRPAIVATVRLPAGAGNTTFELGVFLCRLLVSFKIVRAAKLLAIDLADIRPASGRYGFLRYILVVHLSFPLRPRHSLRLRLHLRLPFHFH